MNPLDAKGIWALHMLVRRRKIPGRGSMDIASNLRYKIAMTRYKGEIMTS